MFPTVSICKYGFIHNLTSKHNQRFFLMFLARIFVFFALFTTCSLSDGYDKKNHNHHFLLCSILMTACDLSFNTKSFDVSKKVTETLYEEFFTQGDLEKALGETPVEMMDKENAYIPAQQVDFLGGIAGPCYE